jgi:hypothetical protein
MYQKYLGSPYKNELRWKRQHLQIVGSLTYVEMQNLQRAISINKMAEDFFFLKL